MSLVAVLRLVFHLAPSGGAVRQGMFRPVHSARDHDLGGHHVFASIFFRGGQIFDLFEAQYYLHDIDHVDRVGSVRQGSCAQCLTHELSFYSIQKKGIDYSLMNFPLLAPFFQTGETTPIFLRT